MKRLGTLMLFAILITFSIISWHFMNKKSLDHVPEKAILVMDSSLRSKTVLIIK